MTSNKNTRQMIKLESILQDIYRILDSNSGITEDDLMESAAAGMSHLYNYKLYERALYINTVDNFKMILPDFYEVEAVFFKEEMDSAELDEVVESVQVDLSDEDINSSFSAINKDNFTTIGTGRLSRKSVFQSAKAATNRGWIPMTLGHGITNLYNMKVMQAAIVKCEQEELMNTVICNTDATSTTSITDQIMTTTTVMNLTTGESSTGSVTTSSNVNSLKEGCYNKYKHLCPSCHNHSYSVSNGTLTVSRPNGYVMVYYKRTPRDEDGDLIIPNHPLVNEALKAYVMMEFHERQTVFHMEGSFRLYQSYLEKWERLSAAASGELVKPSLDEHIEITNLNRMFKGNHAHDIHDNVQKENIDLGYTSRNY